MSGPVPAFGAPVRRPPSPPHIRLALPASSRPDLRYRVKGCLADQAIGLRPINFETATIRRSYGLQADLTAWLARPRASMKDGRHGKIQFGSGTRCGHAFGP